jgi:pimeloyl-ACP methyl ester carboxylesterase
VKARVNRALSFSACFAAVILAGCIVIGDSSIPIGTLAATAPRPSSERTLVIVLPGFGSDAADLEDRGIARAIQESWPEADVLLTSATFAYYRDGKLVPRLREEIVQPSLRKGYSRIWLAGASLGGMGALLYEREYPGELEGIALFAPFLGNGTLLDEIRAAGGPRKWDPGPLPVEMNADNFQRQVWKMIKGWADRPELVRRVSTMCACSPRRCPKSSISSCPADTPGGFGSAPQRNCSRASAGNRWKRGRPRVPRSSKQPFEPASPRTMPRCLPSRPIQGSPPTPFSTRLPARGSRAMGVCSP